MGTVPTEALEKLRSGHVEEAAQLAHATGCLALLADELVLVQGRAGFLGVDLPLVRLLEDVLDAIADGPTAASLRVKLAFELRGDPTSLARRRQLLDQATATTIDGADRDELRLARIHASGTGISALERLDLADAIITSTRSRKDVEREREGRLARFHALLELGRMVEAEVELGRFESLGGAPARPDVEAFVQARRSMLALLRGRYDDATSYAADAHRAADAAGMPDADRLWAMLAGVVALDRGEAATLATAAKGLREEADRFPGHHFEATLATVELARGDFGAVRAALARARPALRAQDGERWLAAASDAAHVAAAAGPIELAEELHLALEPHRDETVVFSAAFSGTVVHALAALEVRLGRADLAIVSSTEAIRRYDDMGALPWAARARLALAAALEASGRATEARIEREKAEGSAADIGLSLDHKAPVPAGLRSQRLERRGDTWDLAAGNEVARLTATRGIDALAILLAHPHRDVDATVLDGGQVPPAGSAALLDRTAIQAYQVRLSEIDRALDRADAVGDERHGERLAVERDAIAAELRRALGLGGRVRPHSNEAERARINVTRNLKRAIEQIARTAPLTAAHLTASVRTGSRCRYEPGDGHERWQVSV